jgi:hypothetical protein
MIIPDPRSRIPDPKTATKERGEKKICCHSFFWSHKFHKIENYFIFEMLKKKIWVSFQRIIELLLKHLSLSSQKYGLFRIPDPGPGVKKAPDSRSRIRTTVFFKKLASKCT